MAKTKISEFDVDPSNNTDINSINIAEGCAPSGINNAIRQLMSDLKEQQTGASGDNFTVGGNLAVTGTSTFTGATTFNGAVVFSSTITGLGTLSTQDSDDVNITGGSLTNIGTLTLEGTTANDYETTIASDPTADRTITLPDATTTLVGTDTTQTLTNKTINGSQIVDASITNAKLTEALTLATAQASTSGTSINFSSIPSWVKKITLMYSGVSTSGAASLLVQLGDSTGVETSGYFSASISTTTGSNLQSTTTSTTGFIIYVNSASASTSGAITISLLGSNIWVASGNSTGGASSGHEMIASAGTKTLSGTLDKIRFTTSNGTDTFDAGSINIMYE